MSRFDKICWESSAVQMKVKGSINIPELTNSFSTYSPHHPPLPEEDLIVGAFSPTPSIDSGRSTSSVLASSTKYLIHGGPGFSLGLLDSTTGTTSHLPVPMPLLGVAMYDNFSLSEVLSASFAGDAQLWVGTETGSLHVFDVTPELKLTNHAFTKLPDPVSYIATRQPSFMDESIPVVNGSLLRSSRTRTEVLVGSTNGNLTVIVGEANERGGLRNPLKCPRKVIQLGGFEEGGSRCVSSIALVSSSQGDTYWCSCGASIVILRRSDWRVLGRLNGCASLPHMSEELSQKIYISQLLATDVGVWSSISQSSTVLLWDSNTLSLKLQITCHKHCSTQGHLVDNFAQISSLHFSDPLLFVGTRGGHLLCFKIQEDLTVSPEHTTKAAAAVAVSPSSLLTHRLAAATYCSADRPIISIHTTPVPSSLCSSPLPLTPVPTVHVLVVMGSRETKGRGSRETKGRGSSPSKDDSCLVQLYELSSSPHPSPLASPSMNGACSLPSSPHHSFSLSRRNSVANLSDPGSSLPPLSLVATSRHTHSYLPLPDKRLFT